MPLVKALTCMAKILINFEHGCFSFCFLYVLDQFSLEQNLNFEKTSFHQISVMASSGLRKKFSQYYYTQDGVWVNVCLAILDTYF